MESSSLLTKAGEVSGWPGALALRFGPLPFSATRRVQRVPTYTPRSRRAIAQACGSSVERTAAILTKLVGAGLALKVGNCHVRSRRALPVLENDAVPLEIGRQILRCLTEQLWAKDIARMINRPPSNTTCQLQHLLHRGLVVRVIKGVYGVVRPEPAEMPAPIGGTSAAHGA